MEAIKNEIQEVINEGNSFMRKFPGCVTSEVEELTKELKLEERPPVVVFGKSARQNHEISFGTVRKFRIRSKETKKIVIDVPTTPMALWGLPEEIYSRNPR